MKSQIHYALERGDDGMPTRLVWSSAIQTNGENFARQIEIERIEKERQARKPMACCVEWAKERGLWQ